MSGSWVWRLKGSFASLFKIYYWKNFKVQCGIEEVETCDLKWFFFTNLVLVLIHENGKRFQKTGTAESVNLNWLGLQASCKLRAVTCQEEFLAFRSFTTFFRVGYLKNLKNRRICWSILNSYYPGYKNVENFRKIWEKTVFRQNFSLTQNHVISLFLTWNCDNEVQLLVKKHRKYVNTHVDNEEDSQIELCNRWWK